MSDSTNPRPPVRRSLLSWLLVGIAGFVAGAIVASIVFGVVLTIQHRHHQAQLLAATGVVEQAQSLNLFGNSAEAKSTAVKSDDEQQVMTFGKAFVDDLEHNRLTLAYRQMSAEYQKETSRDEFEALVAKHPGVRRLESSEYSRTCKARKSSEGKGWEYYCTARDNNVVSGRNLVNFSLSLTKEENGWVVNDLEVTDENKP